MITFILSAANCFSQKDTIKIGLLVQDKRSKDALHGAELAVRKANTRNSKRYYTISIRNMEGPWGTGSKMAVDLVFQEKVWAMIGAVDGRNCHLAEQVSAKTRVPFLSAWSGDPTLAYAFIPWYFSGVFNDQQKASAIIDEIKTSASNLSSAIVTAGDYDSRMGCGSFIKEASLKGIARPYVFRFDTGRNFDSVSTAIRNLKIRNIIFYGPVSSCLNLKKFFRAGTLSIYCISCSDGEEPIDTRNLDGVIFISPGYHFTEKGIEYKKEYEKTFGKMPGDLASYTYDLTNVIINSAGLVTSPDSLKNSIKNTNYDGVTGSIRFDARGERQGIAGLMTVKKGVLVKKNE